jgi:anthranilate phosphoribosyltransferase
MASNRTFKVENPEQSKAMLLAVLDGEPGPARDIVVLNAGVALYAADVVPSMAEGVALARDTIASGKARAKLDEFVARTRALAQE